jgi:membrane-associated phospholipid phosphatase
MGKKGLLAIVFSIGMLTSYSQNTDTLLKKLDSLEVRGDTTINTDPSAYTKATQLTPKTYFILLGSNFKQLATTPFHLKKKEWTKVGLFSLVAGGVAVANKPINRFAVDLSANNKGVSDVSKFITNFGGLYEVYTLAGLFTYGVVFKTEKEKATTLLATQAYLVAGAAQVVTKALTGVQRPNYYDPVTGKNSFAFHGPFYRFKKDKNGKTGGSNTHSSFPSGHTTGAFAAATVFAMEYKEKPLIPIISYSAATLIGLSRLTENKHWATDVLVGAALGYLSGKQVVNNYHRYAELKDPKKQKKKDISVNVQYSNGHFEPGFVYRF